MCNERIEKIQEWDNVKIPDLNLSRLDRKLINQLGEKSGRVDIVELADAVQVSTFSYVGVIKFSEVEIHIVPKMAGEYLGVIDMLALTDGIDSFNKFIGFRTSIVENDDSLFDMIAWAFVDSCSKIIRQGYLNDYLAGQDDLPVLRGRLMVAEQFSRHFGQVNRLACEFDLHDSNILENQIILSALMVCRRKVKNRKVKSKISSLIMIFSDLCSPKDIDIHQIKEELIYNRLNEHYKSAHEIAWVIFEGLGIHNLYDYGSVESFSFLFDMNLLFENFIGNYIEFCLPKSDFNIRRQIRNSSVIWDMQHAKSYRRIIPDFLVRTINDSEKILPIDAKYKNYDDRKLSNSDIYQLFLYSFTLVKNKKIPQAFILYPSKDLGKLSAHLQIRTADFFPGAEIKSIGVHIPSAIDEMKSKKLGQMGRSIQELIIGATIN